MRSAPCRSNACVGVTDITLRDGSIASRRRLTSTQIGSIVAALARAGVRSIEIGAGRSLVGASPLDELTWTDERELLTAALQSAPPATVSVPVVAGRLPARQLQALIDLGVRKLRVVIPCSDLSRGVEQINLARRLGTEVVGVLKDAHMLHPGPLADQAVQMEIHGAQSICVADSSGVLVPDTVRSRILAVREALEASTDVGFCASDNLGAAVANTLAAIDEGAGSVDGSLGGVGAGAGNLASEAFAAVARQSGITTGLDIAELAEAAESVLHLLRIRPRRTRESVVFACQAGPSFLRDGSGELRRFGRFAPGVPFPRRVQLEEPPGTLSVPFG